MARRTRLDHKKLERTWHRGSADHHLRALGLELKDAEGGERVLGGQRRATEGLRTRTERVEAALVEAAKHHVRNHPRGDWWKGQKIRRQRVCEWLMENLPEEARRLWDKEEVSLRTLFNRTTKLQHWTRTQCEQERAEDPRLKLVQAERAKRQHPPHL